MQRLQRTGVDVTFTYDHSGIRTGKRVNRNGAITEHSFYTQNGTIVGETRRHPNGNIDRLEFIYDEAGRPLQLIFNGRIYNYVLNLQGDVQQIRRATDGVVVATYLYNAWGQLLSSTGSMAESNPLRYRGYFWCSAAEMYYLQSRFYDPVVGRFLNWDGLVSTGQGFLGFNMFTYCNNNPVMHIDPSGYIMAGWSPNMTQAQIAQQNAAVAVWVVQQLGTPSPNVRVTCHAVRVEQMRVHGFHYNVHGVRITPQVHSQVGYFNVDLIRREGSVLGSWGPAITVALYGIMKQPALVASTIIDSNYTAHGFTVIGFANAAIDFGIGLGVGAGVRRVAREVPQLAGIGPLARSIIEEAIGGGLGQVRDWVANIWR